MFDATQDVKPLDLLEAARTPQARSQLMESLCELIMRKVSFLMFQKLRCKTTILSCVNAIVSHDAALSSFPDIMLAGIVDLKSLHARAIIAVEGDLIGAVVDELCGATSTDMYVREELSVMEMRFGKQMIDITIAAMAEVFANLVQLDGTISQYETSRGMLSIDEAQAWMISTTGIFELTLGFGSIKLIVPYAAFESLETRINSRGALICRRGDRCQMDAHARSAGRGNAGGGAGGNRPGAGFDRPARRAESGGQAAIRLVPGGDRRARRD